MSNEERANNVRRTWRRAAIREIVIAAAKKLAEFEVAAPPLAFYEGLADQAQEIADEAIAEAIEAPSDAAVVENIRTVRHLFHLQPHVGRARRSGMGYDLEHPSGGARLYPRLHLQGLHEGRRSLPRRRVPRANQAPP
jgi:hypothetical protein